MGKVKSYKEQLPRKKAESQCGHLVATVGIADKAAKQIWSGSCSRSVCIDCRLSEDRITLLLIATASQNGYDFALICILWY